MILSSESLKDLVDLLERAAEELALYSGDALLLSQMQTTALALREHQVPPSTES